MVAPAPPVSDLASRAGADGAAATALRPRRALAHGAKPAPRSRRPLTAVWASAGARRGSDSGPRSTSPAVFFASTRRPPFLQALDRRERVLPLRQKFIPEGRPSAATRGAASHPAIRVSTADTVAQPRFLRRVCYTEVYQPSELGFISPKVLRDGVGEVIDVTQGHDVIKYLGHDA